MKYLAIDTSGAHLTVIARNEDNVRTIFKENCGLKHSVTLMTEVENALTQTGLKPDDVDFFACCVGPGSFTGIRIGISTVKGLAFATGKKVLGVTAFDCLAYNRITEPLLTLVDAGHGHVYAAGYKDGEADIPPAYVSVEEANAVMGRVVLASSEIEGVAVQAVPLSEGFRAAVEANVGRADADAERLIPLYIRKSQAEEGR